MVRLRDLSIEKTSDGRRLLRFTTIIINVGVGRFELRGQRATASDPMKVSQRIFDTTGGFRDISTPAGMVFAGDGHSHWHVRDLESYELVRVDNGTKVGTGEKHGFCFYDNYKYNLTFAGAPQNPFYLGCSNDPSALALTMGLSVGWGDSYPYTIRDQYIDITGRAAGRYRLLASADAANWFVEVNEANNTTSVDIQLQGKGTAFKILGYGAGY
jgi:hypothetical protein